MDFIAKFIILTPNLHKPSQLFDHKYEIKVDEPFEVTNTFRPMNRSKATPKAGTHCTIVGWGSTINVSELHKKFTFFINEIHLFPLHFGRMIRR